MIFIANDEQHWYENERIQVIIATSKSYKTVMDKTLNTEIKEISDVGLAALHFEKYH